MERGPIGRGESQQYREEQQAQRKKPPQQQPDWSEPANPTPQVAGPQESAQKAKSKISHRSQSSPSSLTTHKFGLRPTPSPPRLIIDHNTGDIVESYPEQPVYLRTYQPLEGELAGEDSLQLSQDDSLGHPYPPALGSRQLADYQRLLEEQYGRAAADQYLAESLAQEGLEMSGQRALRPVIPPPHSASGRAYAGAQLEGALSGSHNSSFKRALNKLHEQEGAKTDIALLAAPEAGAPARVKITATSAARGSALLARQRSDRQQVAPAAPERPRADIDDFALYDLCFNFRILLLLLTSGLVEYLLAGPLAADCTLYRPTYTYASVVTAGANLTFALVFSLFWCCGVVTRSLYANLSSSAFIVTIYSILVAVNLAVGVLFFFINTCHFQRLIKTGPAGPLAAALPGPLLLELSSLGAAQQRRALLAPPEPARWRRHSEEAWRPAEDEEAPAPELTSARPSEPAAESPAQEQRERELQLSLTMSPIEAAWEFARRQVSLGRRHFRHFLLHYDLRFVGALHALCAVCLQYLAMRVAAVRSHFCSPVGSYL